MSLGFEQAGFDIKYAIESDKYAAETYKKNREDLKVVVDDRKIQDIAPNEILKKIGIKKGELDIIIGGPPCQGFSTSNMKTRTLNNPNNHMVFNFVEFVKKLNPKWFLMENVAGNLLAEADLNDNITQYYIHGLGLLAMVTPADEVYTYHYNAAGNTVWTSPALVDTFDGTIVINRRCVYV